MLVLLVSLLMNACGAGDGRDPADDPVLYDLVEESRFAEWRIPDGESGARNPNRADSLSIAIGQGVDFYLKIPDRSTITIDRVTARGPSNAVLTVSLQRAGEAARNLGPFPSHAAPTSIPLPDGPSTICKLSFFASTGPNHEGASEIVLVGPLIRSPLRGKAIGNASHQTPGDSDSGKRPDVIIYLIDTLRADRLGIYGYDRPVSPHIDTFAGEALVFDDAVAQSSWTKPSIVSMFSGLTPSAHGVNSHYSVLPAEVLTMAEILSEAGYETAGIVTNHLIGEDYGFAQGFDTFLKGGYGVNKKVDRILEARDREKPLFLYVHTFDPHSPYDPPPSYHQRFAAGAALDLGHNDFLKKYRQQRLDGGLSREISSLYDAEVAASDEQFGSFIEILRKHQLFDESLIIFLSDHGEEFWEHGGWGHGYTLYSEVLKIPLIIKEPSAKRRGRIPALVQHVDVFSTVLDYAGINPPRDSRGRSIRDLLSAKVERSIYSVLDRMPKGGSSVTVEDWKLILPTSRTAADPPELYNRRTDPVEKTNLFAHRPVVAGYLLMLLRKHELASEKTIGSEVAPMDEKLVKELEALGYL